MDRQLTLASFNWNRNLLLDYIYWSPAQYLWVTENLKVPVQLLVLCSYSLLSVMVQKSATVEVCSCKEKSGFKKKKKSMSIGCVLDNNNLLYLC